MHQFQPQGELTPSGVAGAARSKPALGRYRRNEMPSSTVPYIEMLPEPAPEPAPPCAHALHTSSTAAMARKRFMTADSAMTEFDSSLAGRLNPVAPIRQPGDAPAPVGRRSRIRRFTSR